MATLIKLLEDGPRAQLAAVETINKLAKHGKPQLNRLSMQLMQTLSQASEGNWEDHPIARQPPWG
jgi:hypothetical protein